MFRSRRRSGSSIVVIDGDDLKPCLPDDYIHSHQHKYSDSEDFDKNMLKMLHINQGNGKFPFLGLFFIGCNTVLYFVF